MSQGFHCGVVIETFSLLRLRMDQYRRKNGPNILVLGTPGTGKSTVCNNLLKILRYKFLNVSDMIKGAKLYKEWDDDLNCSIYDEKKLKLALKNISFRKGGYLIEFHSCQSFDANLIDHVIVLTTNIEILGKRLEARGYTENKIIENVQCEIFQVVYVDAVEHFGEEKVKCFDSNEIQDHNQVINYVQKILN